MQAASCISAIVDYTRDMPMGRPPAKPRTSLGERIASARIAAGLTQLELAQKIRTSQRVVTYWERESVSLKPEQIAALAVALETSADYLLGIAPAKQRGSGPEGKAKRVFQAVSSLSRPQQQKILDVVETLIAGELSKAA